MIYSLSRLRVQNKTANDRLHNALVDEVSRLRLTVCPPLRIAQQSIEGGTTIALVPEVKTGGSGGSISTPTVRPFDISVVAATLPNMTLTLVPGVVNQLLPSNILSPFTIQNNLSYMVWLAVTTDGRTVTSITVSVDTSLPAQGIASTAVTAPTAFNIVLGSVVNGVVTQLNHGNVIASTSQTMLQDRNPPVPGLSVTIKWYTWALSFYLP